MARSLNIFHDIQSDSILLAPEGGSTTFKDLFKNAGCKVPVTYSPIDFKGSQPFAAELGAPDTLELVIGRTETSPHHGTFTVAIDGTPTPDLPVDITARSLQAYLNDIAGDDALIVTTPSCADTNPSLMHSCGRGCGSCKSSANGGTTSPITFEITAAENGVAPTFTVDTAKLVPNFTADVEQIEPGSVSTPWQVMVTLREDALARVVTGSWTAVTDSKFTVTTVTEGGATNEVQEISLAPASLGGAFSVVIPEGTTREISVFSTAPDLEAALNDCAGANSYSVDGAACKWEITFLANKANQSPVTVLPKGMLSSLTYTALLDLDTLPMRRLLRACDPVEATAAIIFENANHCFSHSEEIELHALDLRGIGPASDVEVPQTGDDRRGTVVSRGASAAQAVEPTLAEHGTPINGDTSSVVLANGSVVEFWSYNSGWALTATVDNRVDASSIGGSATADPQSVFTLLASMLTISGTAAVTTNVGDDYVDITIPAGYVYDDLIDVRLDNLGSPVEMDISETTDETGSVRVHFQGQETLASGHRVTAVFQRLRV